MSNFLEISSILKESDSYSSDNFDTLKQDKSKIPDHIRTLQGRVKSHTGAELTGTESVAALKRIKEKFPKEWEQVMNKQSEVEKPWMKNEA